ncbi:MAG TPA: hypothetical protein VIU65_07450, partial [Pyrinomonadaceae bacterium]
HKIKVLDPALRTVKSFAGTGKPGQTDGAQPSFYEPGGLAVAGEQLYVADTNNHAIRVVDLKTKETRTLAIKDLQPPATNQTATEPAVNEEEIKLPAQKVRTGYASLLINVQLPPGYHLNQSAPHRYRLSVLKGAEFLVIDPQNSSGSVKNPQLPIRIPVHAASSGAAEARAEFTFVYCREDNTGVCRIKTLIWRAPVEIVNDPAAPAEINLSGKVSGE